MNGFEFDSSLWMVEDVGGWHFLTLPEDISKDIKNLFGSINPSFGSVPVEVVISSAKWQTSLFYDTKRNAYLLPVKAIIRKKLHMTVGETYHTQVHVRLD